MDAPCNHATSSANWLAVSNARPCAVCGAKRKCTYLSDGSIAKCCKQAVGAFKTTADDVGPAYFHRLINGKLVGSVESDDADELPNGLSVEFVHNVYASLFTVARILIPRHEQDLARRGFTPEQVAYNGYASLGRERAQSLAGNLHRTFGDEIFKVPGFSKWEDGTPRLYYPHAKITDKWEPVRPVLKVPVRDADGRVISVKLRIDDDRWDGPKYVYLTSAKSGGSKAVSAVHVPKGIPPSCEAIRITEGELKADAAFFLDGHPIISIPGVSSWKKALPVVKQLGAKQAILAFDADCRTNPDVANALRKLFQALIADGLEVAIEHWDIADGKGIDDLLVGGKIPQIVQGDAAAEFVAAAIESSGADRTKPAVTIDPRLVTVRMTFNERSIANQVIDAISREPNLFQRSGSLVMVAHDAPVSRGIERPESAPAIMAIPEPLVREAIAANVALCEVKNEGTDKEELVQVRTPSWTTKAIHQRGQWEGIRKLEAVVSYPVIRADGSVLTNPGYDPQTGLYLDLNIRDLVVTDSPLISEVRTAIGVLKDLIAEFPFKDEVHRSCWLALLLTPLARFAFQGPTPLFMVDANTAGSGKSLISDLICQIVTGMDFARMAPCRDDDEMRKRITSIALRADPLILLDNVAGELGGPALDAALTSTMWKDRLLGFNRDVCLPLYSVWVATGNNVVVVADTTRRICHIRLSSRVERPEERTGFKYPKIVKHVQQNRAMYLAAALTVLSGYCYAGRPQMPMKHWGSFEGWSDIVRQSLIWAGEPDPADAREQLILRCSDDTAVLRDLITGWEFEDPKNEGMTVSEVVAKLDEMYTSETFKNAIHNLCKATKGKPISAVSLGKHLRKHDGRVIGGKCLTCTKRRDNVMVWCVVSAGDAGDSGDI